MQGFPAAIFPDLLWVCVDLRPWAGAAEGQLL
jgi:hypothetical protein